MIFVYIFGALALICAAILLTKVTVRIEWCGGLWLTVGIGPVRLTREVTRNEKGPEETSGQGSESGEGKSESKSADIPLKELLPLVKDTVDELMRKTRKHLKLERWILKINVATGDPAVTGVLYGAVSAAGAQLMALVTSLKRVTRRKNAIYTEITPDFISETPDVFLDAAFSMNIWRGISMLFTAWGGYKKYRALKKRKERQNERHPAQTDN